MPSTAACVIFLSSRVFSRKRAAEDWRLTSELGGPKPFSKGSSSEVSNSGSSSHFSLPAPSIVDLGSPPSSTSRCFRYTWERNDSYLVYGFFCEHRGIGQTIEKRESAAWVFPICRSTAENLGLANSLHMQQQYILVDTRINVASYSVTLDPESILDPVLLAVTLFVAFSFVFGAAGTLLEYNLTHYSAHAPPNIGCARLLAPLRLSLQNFMCSRSELHPSEDSLQRCDSSLKWCSHYMRVTISPQFLQWWHR